MMKKYLTGVAFAVLLTVATVPVNALAETTTSETSSISGMIELLQSLVKQVETLQKQLAELRGEIKSELKDGLREGMSDDDIKKVQELLATDPNIYPKGIVSGYFGPLTKEAVKRFQERHDVKATGEVDSETKKLMLEYFKERANGKFPPGLLRAPGIDKKILERLKIGADGKKYLDCDDSHASGPLCKDKKADKMNDDDDDIDKEKLEISITSITNSENPTVKGKAYGTNAIGFSVGSKAGDKVYGSGDVKVENNSWTHRISTDLEDGRYILIVYVKNKEVARKSFTIDTSVAVEVISVSNAENPQVKGTANNTDKLSFSVGSKAGDKVYGSGDINVNSGEWSHTISTDLADDTYKMTVYVNNVVVAEKTFEVKLKG